MSQGSAEGSGSVLHLCPLGSARCPWACGLVSASVVPWPSPPRLCLHAASSSYKVTSHIGGGPALVAPSRPVTSAKTRPCVRSQPRCGLCTGGPVGELRGPPFPPNNARGPSHPSPPNSAQHSGSSRFSAIFVAEAPGSDAPCPLGGPRSHSGRVAGCQGDQEALREAPGGAVAGPSADEGAPLRHRGWDVPAARPKAGPVLRDAWTLTEATGKPRAQPVPFCPRSALRGVVPGANRNDAILEPLLQV